MSSEINVEDIMAQIRRNIKERGYDKEPLSFEEVELSRPVLSGTESFDAAYFEKELKYLNTNWNNSYQAPVAGGNPVSVLIRRVIRKCTRFIVFPIVNFQNAYNASNVRCMNQIKEYMAELETYKSKVEELEKEMNAMKGRQSQ